MAADPTKIIVCSACGTKNRVRSGTPAGAFRCGSCHGLLARPGWLERVVDATPELFFRSIRGLVEIIIFAILIWVACDSIAHPKQKPDKSTASYPTATPHPQLQPVSSLEELRAAAIAALPSPQLAPTPAAMPSPGATGWGSTPEGKAFLATRQAQEIINRREVSAMDRAKVLQALYDATYKNASKPPQPHFDQPEEPIPASGEIATYPGYRNRAVAPFEITPSSDANYLVKLTDASTGAPVQTIFVRSGSSVKVKVPLGTFTVKYAVGVKWYGYRHLFGPATSYSKASEPFAFTNDATGYTGYTITLYKVRDGNLQTQSINPDEF